MPAAEILLSNEIEIEKVVHDKKKARGKGGHQNCRITYGNNDFIMQTPKCRLPFGLSQPKPEFNQSGIDKFSFELSLNTDEKYDAGGKIAEFKHVLESFDESNVTYISESSKEWWGKPRTKDIVSEMVYHSVIKVDKNKDGRDTTYPSRFKVKLPMYQGIPQFKVYDASNGNEEIVFCKEVDGVPVVDWSWVSKGSDIVAICKCDGLWVIQDKVYCNWKAVAIKVYRSDSMRIDGDAFRNDGDDEEVSEITEKMKETSVSTGAPVPVTEVGQIEDSDAEEEVSEEEEEDVSEDPEEE